MSERPDAVVVGAGPYGLAVAAHLRAAAVRFRIFGEPMATWESHMPEGLFLKSEGFASSIADPDGRLTLERFCAEAGHDYEPLWHPVPRETFLAYGHWFQRQAVPTLEPVRVLSVARAGDGFELELAGGERVRAPRVVVATGLTGFAYVPPELEGLPPGLASHTYDHLAFAAFAGKRVAVVGAGQSALESAALLREQGASPLVLARAAEVSWNPDPVPGERSTLRRLRAPRSPLGDGWKLWACTNVPGALSRLPAPTRVRIVQRTLGPAGAWWLRRRVEGEVEVRPGVRVVAAVARNGGVRLTVAGDARTEELDVDHVIAGTGYRVSLDRIGLLSPELSAAIRLVEGAPALSASFESSVPGLHFVGLAAGHTFGPMLRFVCGSGFAARRVTAGVAARAAGRGRASRRVAARP